MGKKRKVRNRERTKYQGRDGNPRRAGRGGRKEREIVNEVSLTAGTHRKSRGAALVTGKALRLRERSQLQRALYDLVSYYYYNGSTSISLFTLLCIYALTGY